MLQYTDVERVFRFLHVARGKCREHGADLHVHLTPSAHDVSAVATLRQVFDEQRRVSSAGPDGEGTQGGAAPIADGVDGTPRGG